MFQKALSGEEKSDLGTTTTKLGEDKEEPGVSCPLSPHLDSEPALAAADHIPLASREKAAAWSGQQYGNSPGHEGGVAGWWWRWKEPRLCPSLARATAQVPCALDPSFYFSEPRSYCP